MSPPGAIPWEARDCAKLEDKAVFDYATRGTDHSKTDQTLREVGQLFIQAIPTVIFVGFLVFILERLFFRPVAAVLKRREEASSGALERARQRTALAEAKAQEYEALWQKARQEIHRLRDADRRTTLASRDEVIRSARERAEALVRESQNALAREAEAARAELARTGSALAADLAEAILGRPEPASGEGEITG